MTKEEALTYLEMWIKQDTNLLNNGRMDTQENIDIYNVAIECIQHCIDEEKEDENFCNSVEHQHCSICGKLIEDTENRICEDCFKKFNDAWK